MVHPPELPGRPAASIAALPPVPPLAEPPSPVVQEQPTIVRTRPETAVVLLLAGDGVTAYPLTRGGTPAAAAPAAAATIPPRSRRG